MMKEYEKMPKFDNQDECKPKTYSHVSPSKNADTHFWHSLKQCGKSFFFGSCFEHAKNRDEKSFKPISLKKYLETPQYQISIFFGACFKVYQASVLEASVLESHFLRLKRAFSKGASWTRLYFWTSGFVSILILLSILT